MTHLRLVTWSADDAHRPAAHPLRRLAATALRGASRALARMAHRVAEPAAPTLPLLPETLEFYADASAPEGALYLDGHLIGHLPGVKRL
ncbi:hypothetical protein LRS03_20965 [Rhizobacter sp. J219]|uniref:hypothetical protein n=1 Tax=Rhizobacter sp. J219 TaxID=2898430 RepID=UPI002150F2A4|nr:hypothetical protein [Rhizobacter sp. J219]MCR5885193.1 hypothetical protein [Rhizobacter sp. J219]